MKSDGVTIATARRKKGYHIVPLHNDFGDNPSNSGDQTGDPRRRSRLSAILTAPNGSRPEDVQPQGFQRDAEPHCLHPPDPQPLHIGAAIQRGEGSFDPRPESVSVKECRTSFVGPSAGDPKRLVVEAQPVPSLARPHWTPGAKRTPKTRIKGKHHMAALLPLHLLDRRGSMGTPKDLFPQRKGEVRQGHRLVHLWSLEGRDDRDASFGSGHHVVVAAVRGVRQHLPGSQPPLDGGREGRKKRTRVAFMGWLHRHVGDQLKALLPLLLLSGTVRRMVRLHDLRLIPL